eukprot:4346744-Pyramimonas_sp.AAC.1
MSGMMCEVAQIRTSTRSRESAHSFPVASSSLQPNRRLSVSHGMRRGNTTAIYRRINHQETHVRNARCHEIAQNRRHIAAHSMIRRDKTPKARSRTQGRRSRLDASVRVHRM